MYQFTVPTTPSTKTVQVKHGDKVTITERDTTRTTVEYVGMGGVYPSQDRVHRGEATATILASVEESPWWETDPTGRIHPTSYAYGFGALTEAVNQYLEGAKTKDELAAASGALNAAVDRYAEEGN